MVNTCKTCGRPIQLEFSRCVCCSEVESFLPTYISSPKGLNFVRNHLPLLEDWVDGVPDAWDYEAVLTKHGATVNMSEPAEYGWTLVWRNGCMGISANKEVHARKAAALFIELWLRGVSASFADKITDGYLYYLEASEKHG